jgi:cytoskeletal protein CcmA (bactofilin family)
LWFGVVCSTTGYPSAATPSNEPAYKYGEAQTQSQRVVTDSESMARDIKEGRLSGFVGHGTTLTGETNFQMLLRVDGHLMGTISSDSGTLLVGTNGQVDANIAVASATINGAVNGDILASEKIHLGRTARVVGNIQTPKVVIEEGAILEGSCTMLKAREASEKRSSEARSQPAYNTSGYSSYQEPSAEPEAEASDEFLGTTTEDDEAAEAASV